MTDTPPTDPADRGDPPGDLPGDPGDLVPDDPGALELLSNAGGQTAQFAAQFATGHAGRSVALLVQLHPGLHHGHLADTVTDVCSVNGVAYARWLRPSPLGAMLMNNATRGVLAGYTVGITRLPGDSGTNGTAAEDWTATGATGDRQLIGLYHGPSSTALVTAHPSAGGAGFDQAGLHLAELADQALQHYAETGGYDETSSAPESEHMLRCTSCLRLFGAEVSHDVLAVMAGKECPAKDSRTGQLCTGRLQRVTVLVTGGGES